MLHHLHYMDMQKGCPNEISRMLWYNNRTACPMAHFTKYFSVMIQVQWIFGFVLIATLRKWSSYLVQMTACCHGMFKICYNMITRNGDERKQNNCNGKIISKIGSTCKVSVKGSHILNVTSLRSSQDLCVTQFHGDKEFRSQSRV